MTKERLRHYRDIKLERSQIQGLIAEIETSLYGATGQRLDGQPRGGKGGTDAVDNLIVKKDKLVTRYKNLAASLTQELEAIEDAIETLEPRERTLIRLYYIDGLTWEQVCVQMQYSWRQVHRIHSKALEQLRHQAE